MMQTKSCPRCGGDMLREEVLGEVEMVCLQCGHRTYPAPQPLRLATRRSIVKKAA
jgi:NADH pyrophosphatase NudC (nudix superfamily)